jgi:CRP-like cAMP-binding protein
MPCRSAATDHLIRGQRVFAVELAHRTLARNLREHSRLADEDIEQITRLPFVARPYEPNEDVIRQGDTPTAVALVLSGTVGRYHLLSNGHRQYLSFHIIGDMPDAQGLFIEQMDHTVCALGPAVLAFIPHAEIVKAFKARPSLGFAIWRETLIDAAIFREAITNNSARPVLARMAHLFCELFYRAPRLRSDEGEPPPAAPQPRSTRRGARDGDCHGQAYAAATALRQQRGFSRWRADGEELGKAG